VYLHTDVIEVDFDSYRAQVCLFIHESDDDDDDDDDVDSDGEGC
jgi:hypothetical protein